MGKVHIDISLDEDTDKMLDFLRETGRIRNLSAEVKEYIRLKYAAISPNDISNIELEWNQEHDRKITLLKELRTMEKRHRIESESIIMQYKRRSEQGISEPYQRSWIESRWQEIASILPKDMTLEEAYDYLEGIVRKIEV